MSGEDWTGYCALRQLDVNGTRWHNAAAVLAKQDKVTLDGKPPGVIFLAQRSKPANGSANESAGAVGRLVGSPL
jgi:hypothetical protein